MTKLQEKAQAQVKQMVGQMIGDHRLELEGREQKKKADRTSPARDDANPDASTKKKANKAPTDTQSKKK
jgi:uncharacterized protein YjbJ (UPF0337 family)